MIPNPAAKWGYMLIPQPPNTERFLDGSMKDHMRFNLEEIATKGFSMEMGSTISGLSHQIKLPQNFSLKGPLRGPRSTPGGQ